MLPPAIYPGLCPPPKPIDIKPINFNKNLANPENMPDNLGKPTVVPPKHIDFAQDIPPPPLDKYPVENLDLSSFPAKVPFHSNSDKNS